MLVRRIDQEDQIRGGIVIPDTAKEKPQEAEVIAVGPGAVDKEGRRQPMGVRAGDRVLVGKYSGTEIRFDDEELVILREDEILALIGRRVEVTAEKEISQEELIQVPETD